MYTIHNTLYSIQYSYTIQYTYVRIYTWRILVFLYQAKENSIKTFITKNDTLTSDLLQLKDHLFEKDIALKSVNESLEAVMDRCNFKTKQFNEITEANENLDDENRVNRVIYT